MGMLLGGEVEDVAQAKTDRAGSQTDDAGG